jgi:hypothetical protein
MIKAWQKPPRPHFYFSGAKQLIPIVENYRVQEEIIETKNFVPEALMIYHFQDINRTGMKYAGLLKVSEGDKRMLEMHVKFGSDSNPFDDDQLYLFLSKSKDEEKDDKDEEDDDEEWEEGEEDEEDWDDEDVDDEDWDDEDEDWDEDEDEDWDEDEEGEGEEDWGDEEES